MLTYLLRRLLLMIPTLLGITIVVFTVMAMSPGGISAQTLVGGMDMKPQEKQALLEYYNKRYGLDQPAPVQYLRWLNNVSPIGFVTDEHGKRGEFSFNKGMDLGTSFQYGRPVSDILAERIPITLLLNLVTIPFTYLIAIMVGMKSATHRGSVFDVGTSMSMLALWSIPTMLAGVLLLGFFRQCAAFSLVPDRRHQQPRGTGHAVPAALGRSGLCARFSAGPGVASGVAGDLFILRQFCRTGEINADLDTGKPAFRLCPDCPRQRLGRK